MPFYATKIPFYARIAKLFFIFFMISSSGKWRQGMGGMESGRKQDDVAVAPKGFKGGFDADRCRLQRGRFGLRRLDNGHDRFAAELVEKAQGPFSALALVAVLRRTGLPPLS